MESIINSSNFEVDPEKKDSNLFLESLKDGQIFTEEGAEFSKGNPQPSPLEVDLDVYATGVIDCVIDNRDRFPNHTPTQE